MTQNLASTTTRIEASREHWDAVIVGAGIAGSLAARGLARRGHKVLLIERASLPRHKVCGACLNGDAIAGLRTAGVWDPIEAIGGHPLTQYCIRSGPNRATLDLPGGHAVSRFAMDRVLAESAIAAGAQFLSDTAITIGGDPADSSERSLCDNDGNRYQTSILIAANGLASKPASVDPADQVLVPMDSRIGLGAQWSQSEAPREPMHLSSGVIYMAIAENGYVGLVVTENHRINLAAAVDRAAVQAAGPAEVCHQILRSCGWDLAKQLQSTNFRGTPTLTRRRKIAGGHRLFYVGDSSGYVEPFTGEGMAWAIRAGNAIVPWADDAIEQWSAEFPLKWTNDLKRLLGKQQRRCRLISRLLRHPTLVRHTVGAMSRFPKFGRFAVGQIQRERSQILTDLRSQHRQRGTSGDAA